MTTGAGRRAASGPRLLPAAAWSALLAVVLLWPLHRSGYPLGRDMVFTPRPALSWTALGLGTGEPRAVPVDALVALGSAILGGAALSRIALVVPLLLAGTGAAALAGRGGLVAASVAIWNPYVVERLGMGDWALLWAYGALPWIVRAARRARAGGAVGPLLLWVALASITPTGGLIGAVVAAVVAAGGLLRRPAVLLAGLLAVQLAWLVPGAVAVARSTSDPAGVTAFASRAEHAGGTLLTLLGGGGSWNAATVPGSRAGWTAWLWLAVLGAAVLLGWRPAGHAVGVATRSRLAGLAAASLLLAAASSLPGGAAAVRWAVRVIPGAGIVRDAQKWLMPWLLLAAVLAGGAAARLARRAAAPGTTARGTTARGTAARGTAARGDGARGTAARGDGARWGVARGAVLLGAAVLPLLCLPDAAATLRPVLRPVHYPPDWDWARAATRQGGAVLVLPFQPYRRVAWAPGRPVLDPAPRLLAGDVVVSDRLTVGTRTLAGEDPRVAAAARALTGPPPQLPVALARRGIGWVLVERGTPGAVPDLRSLRPVRSGPALRLYRVPGTPVVTGPGTARTAAVLAGDTVAVLAGLLLPVIGLIRGRRRVIRC